MQPKLINVGKETVTCYGQTIGHNWVQEWYETWSRHARKRAKQLRDSGFYVAVSPGSMQVTDVGRVKMSLLSAYGDPNNLPELKGE